MEINHPSSPELTPEQQESLHSAVVAFFDQNAAQLITSPICIAEVLWLLGNPGDSRVLAAQNHLLSAVSRGGIEVIHLLPEDYARVAEPNERSIDKQRVRRRDGDVTPEELEPEP